MRDPFRIEQSNGKAHIEMKGVFEIAQRDANTNARRGRLHLRRGILNTPAFMPVGTKGAVKTLDPNDARECGAEILLGNAYHLWLRPGHETIAKAGGLNAFMAWDKPILTDSGGYQVMSLAAKRKLSEEGAEFRSEIDGSLRMLTPELSIEIQQALNSDVMMCFDECSPHPAPYAQLKLAMERSLRWAMRSKDAARPNGQLLFGIIQGGMNTALRIESAEKMRQIGFPGYAVGGLGVGEEKPIMYEMVAFAAELLPEEKPRYLMGVGTPEDILHAVRNGIDMFDCVLPTRNARHAFLNSTQGPVRIRNAQYKEDMSPIDERCRCAACRRFSRAYLRHLYVEKEPLAARLMTIHNLHFYLHMMRGARRAIENGVFDEMSARPGDLFLLGQEEAAPTG